MKLGERTSFEVGIGAEGVASLGPRDSQGAARNRELVAAGSKPANRILFRAWRRGAGSRAE